MLGSNLLLRAGDLLVVIVAAAHLPVEAFGRYVLVLTFYSLFRLAGDGGMQHLLIRDMAQDRPGATRHFSDALGFQIVWSSALAVIYVVTVLVLGYRGDLFVGLLIALIAIVPDNLSLTGTAAIQAAERLEYLVVVNGVTSALRVIASVAVLWMGYGFLAVVICMVLSRAAACVMVQRLATRRLLSPPFGTTRKDVTMFARRLVPFLVITLMASIFLRLDTILLSKVAGETAVAVFGVGVRLSEPAILVAGSFALAIYPTLSATFRSDRASFVRVYAGAMRGTLLAGLIVIGIGNCLAPVLVGVLFGARYVASIAILKVFLWYLVLFAVDQVSGRVLLAAGRQDVNLKVISIGTALVTLLLLVLAPRMGPAGAALADTLSLLAMVAIELAVVARLVPEVGLLRAVLVPALGLVIVGAAGELAAALGWGLQLMITTALTIGVAGLTRLVRPGDVVRIQAAVTGWRARKAAVGAD